MSTPKRQPTERQDDAPPFIQIWSELGQIPSVHDGPHYAWNANFDRQALLRMVKHFELTIPELIVLPEIMEPQSRWRCAMKLHIWWYGEWSNGRNTYRWQPLE